MFETFAALPRLFVILSQLRLVDGVSFLFASQRGPEIAAATLHARHKMTAQRRLQRSLPEILPVQRQRVLQESQRQIKLADGVKDQPDVGVEQRHFRMTLPVAQQRQITRAVKQFQRGCDVTVGEAIQRQIGVLGDRVRMIQAQNALGHQDGLLLVAEGFAVIACHTDWIQDREERD